MNIRKLLLKCKLAALNKKNLQIVLIVFILGFFLITYGAYLNQKQISPYTSEKYQLYKNLKKFGLNYKEELKKIDEAEELRKKLSLKEDGIHTQNAKVSIIKLNANYDLFDILSYEDESNIQLIAIKGNFSSNPQKATNLKIYKVDLNIQNEDYHETLLLSVDDNLRAGDVLVTKEKKIFISYLSQDEKKYGALKVAQLVEKDNEYSLDTVFINNSVPPPNLTAQASGKMIELKDGNIMFSIGSYGENYLNDIEKYNLGDNLVINIKNKSTKIFSTGHRNSQGLLFSRKLNAIINTEHGPHGGDEINHVEYNKNYGWPNVTYGRPYETQIYQDFSNYGNTHYLSHDGYRKPVYSFIPSIGIKAIAEFPEMQSEFPTLKDSFLICSARGIYRAEIEKENNSIRVILVEHFLNNEPCRDIRILSNGIVITNTLTILRRVVGVHG